MVKRVVFVGILLIVLSSSVFAQDPEFPRIETAMGYASLGFPTGPNGEVQRHSGFSMHNTLNVFSWFGIENYTGVYSLGNDVTLFANILGGRLMYRGLAEGKISPYVVAGFGGAYLTSNFFGGSSMAARYGGGIDLQLSDSMGLKLEAGRLRAAGETNLNISAGVVFRIQ